MLLKGVSDFSAMLVPSIYLTMMTSSNGNFFRVTGHLCGEFTGPGELPAQRPVTRSFDVFFDLRWINGWVNNHEADDLWRYRFHYDVTVMHKSLLVYWHHYTTKLLGYIGFTPSARLSVRVGPASRIHTVLVGFISYLYILSSNFRKCVACKVSCKISKFEFGNILNFVSLTLSRFDLGSAVNHLFG